MNRLKELRENRGWSQRQTAMKAGLAPTTYHNYETGLREPDMETFGRLADLFGVSVDYLIGKAKCKMTMDEYNEYMAEQFRLQEEAGENEDVLLIFGEEIDVLIRRQETRAIVRNLGKLTDEQIAAVGMIVDAMAKGSAG